MYKDGRLKNDKMRWKPIIEIFFPILMFISQANYMHVIYGISLIGKGKTNGVIITCILLDTSRNLDLIFLEKTLRRNCFLNPINISRWKLFAFSFLRLILKFRTILLLIYAGFKNERVFSCVC